MNSVLIRAICVIRGRILPCRPAAVDRQRDVPAQIGQQQRPQAVGDLNEILLLNVERPRSEAAEVAVLAGVKRRRMRDNGHIDSGAGLAGNLLVLAAPAAADRSQHIGIGWNRLDGKLRLDQVVGVGRGPGRDERRETQRRNAVLQPRLKDEQHVQDAADREAGPERASFSAAINRHQNAADDQHQPAVEQHD